MRTTERQELKSCVPIYTIRQGLGVYIANIPTLVFCIIYELDINSNSRRLTSLEYL